MFKRGILVILSLAMAFVFVAGCNKKEDAVAPASDVAVVPDAAAAPTDAAAPAAAPAEAAAPAAAPADAAAPAAAPAAGAPEAVPAVGAPEGSDEPLPPVPAEAQAAVDKLIEVLSAIAAAGEQETCAAVLTELKKIDTPETKAKLEASLILQKYPEDVQRAINQANQNQMLAVAFKMAAYQKCQSAPENDAIDATIKQILAPIAPEESDVPVAAEAEAVADKAEAAVAPAAAAPTAPAAAAPAAPAAVAPAAPAAAAPSAPAAEK